MIRNRFALVKLACPHCLKAIKAINHVNRHLPPEKRIEVKDCFEYENYGLKLHPVMDRLDPESFKGYPYLYIDGIEIGGGDAGAGETDGLIIILGKLVEQDLLSPIIKGKIHIGSG